MTLTNEELALAFEQTGGKLKSFLLRLTASVADAEDILQDTFLRAAEKRESFRGDSSVHTWLFSIGINLARDNLRAQKRWVEQVTDIAREAALNNPQFLDESMRLHTASSQGAFEIREHIAFCFTCISKSLPLEQQLALLLKEVHEFSLEEISVILETNVPMIKYYLHAARAKMVAVFDGRCALINKQGICHQCSELNGMYNPKQKLQEELVKIEMAKKATTAGKEKLFDLRMELVRGIDPFTSRASALELHHLEHNRQVMEKYLEKNPV